MTPFPSDSIGLSVGTTVLAAVSADRVGTARPVLTRAGVTVDDVVERVGDPVGIVAADGSMHPAATLLADALRDLARGITVGAPLPSGVTVAYPAYWEPRAIEALRRALRRIPAWGSAGAGPTLIPDYAAALAAVERDPALPDHGNAVVCDIGARATTITLVDLGDSGRAIGPARRYPDFSGELIDQALLSRVIAATGVGPGRAATSAIGPLIRLRSDCRAAKERLSVLNATVVPAGGSAGILLTRPELDELIRSPLTAMVDAIRDMLRHNGIPATELTAVVAVGGGAAIPAVTATLFRRLGVPVITTARPGLAAATGAAMRVSRTVVPAAPEQQASAPPVAWSRAYDVPDLAPPVSQRRRSPATQNPRPRLKFEREPEPAPARAQWWRRWLPVAVAGLVAAAAVGVTGLALSADGTAAPIDPAPRTVVAVPAIPMPSG